MTDVRQIVNGKLRHCISIDGLDRTMVNTIFETAQSYINSENCIIYNESLSNKMVANLFFEPSTRTRSSFEIAAKHLSAKVINFSVENSALSKGETLLDMVNNLAAMDVDLFVVRHKNDGTSEMLAKHCGVPIVNAGDGCNQHPSQALLDLFTIQQHFPDFTNLSIAIVGDVAHSRVARSQIQLMQLLSVPDIRVIAPQSLLSDDIKALGVSLHDDLSTGLDGVNVAVFLRIQKERMDKEASIPSDSEYHAQYGLKPELLKPDVLLMHPGPVNRDVEIASELLAHPQSAILQQVHNGVAIRMALMTLILQ